MTNSGVADLTRHLPKENKTWTNTTISKKNPTKSDFVHMCVEGKGISFRND